MRKNKSENSSKKYPNLYKMPGRPHWVFRKYSSQKREEFYFSTGVPHEPKYEAEAYKKGVEAFNEWLGSFTQTGRRLLVKDIARAVLASKEGKKGGKQGATYRSAHNQILNHIVPEFGHLRPDQVTPGRWENYDQAERRKGRTALANTRKYLSEILKRAKEEGHLKFEPKLKLFDPKAAPPKYIRPETVRKILRLASGNTKLWGFIMWKQGARPSEILQYRWDMIDFNEGEHGMIHIPAAITKTGRARSIPLNSRVSRLLRRVARGPVGEWLFPSPVNLDQPMKEYKTGWETACSKASVRFTPYNLRDTFITDCLKRGTSSTFIGRYCDTSPEMIDRKYAVAERDAMSGVAG